MFDKLFNSFKGILRTTGGIIGAIGGVMLVVPIPHIQAWGLATSAVGGMIAGIGVARAGAGMLVSK